MTGYIIGELMHDKGMTQKQLAEKASISQSSLSDIINGTTRPKRSTLERIAEALAEPMSTFGEHEAFPKTCPVCRSRAVLEWTNHETGSCRLRCGYCGADSMEQKTRNKAIAIFNGFGQSKNPTTQEVFARVLSVGELLNVTEYDDDFVRPVWFENRGLFIIPALLQCSIADRENEIVHVAWCEKMGAQFFKIFTMEQYGSWWRVWNRKPTKEQSEATPWTE